MCQHKHKLRAHLVPNEALEGKLVTQSIYPPILQILGDVLAYLKDNKNISIDLQYIWTILKLKKLLE